MPNIPTRRWGEEPHKARNVLISHYSLDVYVILYNVIITQDFLERRTWGGGL